MYDQQGSTLATQIAEALGNPQLAEAILNTLGNCQMGLTHNGPVTFNGPVRFAEAPAIGDIRNGSGMGRLAVLDEDLTVSSDQQPALATIWGGDAGAEETTGEQVYTWPWGLSSGTTLAAGTEVTVENINDKWYVVSPTGSGGGGAPSFPTTEPGNYNAIAYNTSGSSIAAYSVMKVTGVYDTGTQVALNLATPDTTLMPFYAVMSGDGISASSSGYCSTYGLCRAKYDHTSGTPAYGDEWGVTNSYALIAKGGSGFFILGIIDSTNHHVIAYQRPLGIVKARIAGAALTSSASASGVLRNSVAGADTNMNLTIYPDGMVTSGYKLLLDSIVSVAFNSGRWVLVSCNTCEVPV